MLAQEDKTMKKVWEFLKTGLGIVLLVIFALALMGLLGAMNAALQGA